MRRAFKMTPPQHRGGPPRGTNMLGLLPGSAWGTAQDRSAPGTHRGEPLALSSVAGSLWWEHTGTLWTEPEGSMIMAQVTGEQFILP
jgi:hypothetical protein